MWSLAWPAKAELIASGVFRTSTQMIKFSFVLIPSHPPIPAIWPFLRHRVFCPPVGLLSNLLGLRHERADNGPLILRPATAAEIEPAIALILSPPGASADTQSTREFIAFARERGIDFDGLHVALRDGKLVSAILSVVSPGRTMLMLCPPGAGGNAADAATAQLIDPVCRHSAAQGIHLAQTLVDPGDTALEAIFAQQQFDKMAELHYLQVQVAAGSTFPVLPPDLTWTIYSADNHALFGQAIIDSYKDSLDCPALNGRRNVEDIMAGHHASGIFDPSLWFLLRRVPVPSTVEGPVPSTVEGPTMLGVLLLSKSLRSDAVELVYLGLSPNARGQKLGELMMRQAFAVVASYQQPRLCLAVDSRNTPALKLYYRHGMHRIASKLALLRDLRKLV